MTRNKNVEVDTILDHVHLLGGEYNLGSLTPCETTLVEESQINWPSTIQKQYQFIKVCSTLPARMQLSVQAQQFAADRIHIFELDFAQERGKLLFHSDERYRYDLM